MPCYHPLTAWQGQDDPKVVFDERKLRHDQCVRQLSLPCGRCLGCRIERSRQWAVRIMHEAKCHRHNSFITLTYDDGHAPVDGSLQYRDFQLFMKRLRKEPFARGVRFFMCGEYGASLLRPHYHACLFGVRFPELSWHSGSGEMQLFRSAALERLWPQGFSTIGAVSYQSAAYVARYVVKKVTGSLAEAHYGRLAPEFCHMSLKPGIGAEWFSRFQADVYPHDFVVVNAREAKPPRYYDQLLKKRTPAVFEEIQYARQLRAADAYLDNTPERLAVKEEVAASRLSFKSRPFEL